MKNKKKGNMKKRKQLAKIIKMERKNQTRALNNLKLIIFLSILIIGIFSINLCLVSITIYFATIRM